MFDPVARRPAIQSSDCRARRIDGGIAIFKHFGLVTGREAFYNPSNTFESRGIVDSSPL
jgi:hypothetical protein